MRLFHVILLYLLMDAICWYPCNLVTKLSVHCLMWSKMSTQGLTLYSMIFIADINDISYLMWRIKSELMILINLGFKVSFYPFHYFKLMTWCNHKQQALEIFVLKTFIRITKNHYFHYSHKCNKSISFSIMLCQVTNMQPTFYTFFPYSYTVVWLSLSVFW